MLSRLHLSATEPEEALLRGLPPPRAPGPLSLLHVIGQALAYMSQRESFPALAAVSGAAFAVTAPRCLRPVPSEPPPLQAHASWAGEGARGEAPPAALAPAALPALLHTLGLVEAQVWSAPEGLPAERILRAVAAEAAAHRPVILGGWPPAEPGWALLAGCAPGRLVCGYGPHSRPGDPYLAAPARGTLLVALGPREPADPAALLAAATAAARRGWETDRPHCADLYRAWLHLLSQPAPPAPAAELAAALTALAEARTAARDFLEAYRDDLPPAAGAERAANLYDQLVDLAEPLAAALAPPGGVILWSQPDWRAETRGRLEQIAELDAEAVNSLRRAQEAEYAPEDS
jgi:hypothetical protein